MNHLTIFGQLGFLVKWETGDDGQYDMDVTKLLYDVSALSLGNSENLFLEKTFNVQIASQIFIHRTSQSTSGPVVMALTFPTKQLAVYNTKHPQRFDAKTTPMMSASWEAPG